jgi:hypothetical protein
MSVSLVITSCNRPLELSKTIHSFLQFNTYPIKKFIIIDDSGKKGCIDDCIKFIPDSIERKIIYNEENIGQIYSIDKAYSFVDTEFIFHCEDDWEFYDYGFIEKSMEILNKNEKVCLVWLRPYKNGVLLNNGHTINMNIVDNYRIVDNNYLNMWMGFSFNPGLRRLSDYKLIGNYRKFNNEKKKYGGSCEVELQKIYKKMNKIVVITLNETGYVKHIGWHNPVRN